MCISTINKAFSNTLPQNKVEFLGDDYYSCRICDNIKELSQENSNTYSFDSYRSSFHAKTYQELLINIIHTRYSYDDENNLINDFLEKGTNENYTNYRNFVSWAKETAKNLKGVS